MRERRTADRAAAEHDDVARDQEITMKTLHTGVSRQPTARRRDRADNEVTSHLAGMLRLHARAGQ
jgi:hypothetical protein